MKFHELADQCWHDMPRLRRVLAGRSTVTRLLADTVREFDPKKADAVGYDAELLEGVKRQNGADNRDGFAIMTFLLVTIAAAVISWLIQRWLDNRFPKEQLKEWRRELAA